MVETDTETKPPLIAQLVDGYVQLRDKKAQIKARHDAEISPIDDMLKKIEVRLLAQMQDQGVEAYRTPAGTAYTQKRTSVTAADGDLFLKWCIDTGNTHMLERRPAKTAVDEYVAQMKDLPPGVNYRQELVVNVRRS